MHADESITNTNPTHYHSQPSIRINHCGLRNRTRRSGWGCDGGALVLGPATDRLFAFARIWIQESLILFYKYQIIMLIDISKLGWHKTRTPWQESNLAAKLLVDQRPAAGACWRSVWCACCCSTSNITANMGTRSLAFYYYFSGQRMNLPHVTESNQQRKIVRSLRFDFEILRFTAEDFSTPFSE